MFETINDSITTKLSDIATSQATYFTANGKYEQVLETTIDDFSYIVNEYKPLSGESGYQVVFIKSYDNKEYSKSIGYGSESESGTHDWREIINIA